MIPDAVKSILHALRPFYLPMVYKPKPEPDFLSVCQRYLSHEDIVVEVGSRIGGGTLFLSEFAKQVYAFEPNPNSFQVLSRYIKNRKNVIAYNIALGAKDGEDWLNLPGKYGSSCSSSPKMVTGYSYSHKIKVKVLRLDRIKLSLVPTCLLLDCEGSEVEVLKGAERILGLANKVLVETHVLQNGHSTMDDVSSRLKEVFFRVETFNPGGFPWVIATQT